MVFDKCSTINNLPQSSTSSCTEFFQTCTPKCEPVCCHRCCINSMINDHTYTVLRKICRRIIKDFNRQQCREKYTVFDGGNSVNIRVHRAASSRNPLCDAGGTTGSARRLDECDGMEKERQKCPCFKQIDECLGRDGAHLSNRQLDAKSRPSRNKLESRSKHGGIDGFGYDEDITLKSKKSPGKISTINISTAESKKLQSSKQKRGDDDDDDRAKSQKVGKKRGDDDKDDDDRSKSKKGGKKSGDDDDDRDKSKKGGKKRGADDNDDDDRAKPKKGGKKRGDDDKDDDDRAKSKKGGKKRGTDDGDDDDRDKSKKGGKKRGDDDKDDDDRAKSKKGGKKRGAVDDEDEERDKSKKGGKKRGVDDTDDDDRRKSTKGGKKGATKSKKDGQYNDDDDFRKSKSGKHKTRDSFDGDKTDGKKGKSKGKKGTRASDGDELDGGAKSRSKGRNKGSSVLISNLRNKVRNGQDVVPSPRIPKGSGAAKLLSKFGRKSELGDVDRRRSRLSLRGRKKKSLQSRLTKDGKDRVNGIERHGGRLSIRNRQLNKLRREEYRRDIYMRRFLKPSRYDEERPCDYLRANMELRELCIKPPATAPCTRTYFNGNYCNDSVCPPCQCENPCCN